MRCIMLSLIPDVILHVLSFLSPSDLTPVSRESVCYFRSDIVWKPYGGFVEYVWQRQLEDYKKRYKQQWTQGCLGRLKPPKKNVDLYSARFVHK